MAVSNPKYRNIKIGSGSTSKVMMNNKAISRLFIGKDLIAGSPIKPPGPEED